MGTINHLSKKMNLQFNRSIFGESGLKSREQGNYLKEKLIGYICRVIREENAADGVLVEQGLVPEEPTAQ